MRLTSRECLLQRRDDDKLGANLRGLWQEHFGHKCSADEPEDDV